MLNKLKVYTTGGLMVTGLTIAGSDGALFPWGNFFGCLLLVAALYLSRRCEL